LSKKNINLLKLSINLNQELIIVSVLASVTILLIFVIGNTFIGGFAKMVFSDSLIYFKMSFDPFQSSIAPYMYRLLTPLIIFLLPLNHLLGFIFVNMTALFLTTVLFYYYLKKLDFNNIHAFLGVLFFLLAPTVIYTMYDIALVDFTSFLFFLLAFYAILCKNDKLYLVSLVLGVLNKETILLTLPLYLLIKLENEKLINALKSTLLIILIPLILFISIRYYYGFTNYFSLSTVKETLIYDLQIKSIYDLSNPYFSFNTLWILSIYCIKYVKGNFLKKSLYLLPFIFLQVLIATDMFRALFIAFPIIIPISLYLFKIKEENLVLIFIILTLFILLSHIVLIKGYLASLVFLPLEFVVLSALIIHYLNIKSIIKPLIS